MCACVHGNLKRTPVRRRLSVLGLMQVGICWNVVNIYYLFAQIILTSNPCCVFFSKQLRIKRPSLDGRVKPNVNSCAAVCGIDLCSCVLPKAFLCSKLLLWSTNKSNIEKIYFEISHFMIIINICCFIFFKKKGPINFDLCTPKHKRAVVAFPKLCFFSPSQYLNH